MAVSYHLGAYTKVQATQLMPMSSPMTPYRIAFCIIRISSMWWLSTHTHPPTHSCSNAKQWHTRLHMLLHRLVARPAKEINFPSMSLFLVRFFFTYAKQFHLRNFHWQCLRKMLLKSNHFSQLGLRSVGQWFIDWMLADVILNSSQFASQFSGGGVPWCSTY